MKLLIRSQTSTWEWISNSISHFTGHRHVITHLCMLGLKLILLVKGVPGIARCWMCGVGLSWILTWKILHAPWPWGRDSWWMAMLLEISPVRFDSLVSSWGLSKTQMLNTARFYSPIRNCESSKWFDENQSDFQLENVSRRDLRLHCKQQKHQLPNKNSMIAFTV